MSEPEKPPYRLHTPHRPRLPLTRPGSEVWQSIVQHLATDTPYPKPTPPTEDDRLQWGFHSATFGQVYARQIRQLRELSLDPNVVSTGATLTSRAIPSDSS
jgi:hypothetical protein